MTPPGGNGSWRGWLLGVACAAIGMLCIFMFNTLLSLRSDVDQLKVSIKFLERECNNSFQNH